MKKLLLHVCCAPCSTYVFKKLSEEYNVTGYFYNPNIHPKTEYDFRVTEAKKISEKLGWKMIYGIYEKEKWLKFISGHEDDPERGERCSICFNMRLDEVFKKAKEKGFDIIASTLSISPHKVTEQINREGLQLSKKYGVEFLQENFKKKNGFNIGRKLSLELGIEHQNYCGCIFSYRDRMERLKK